MSAVAFLFPARCFSCSLPLGPRARAGACAACWAALRPLRGPACGRCADPGEGACCPSCLSRTPDFDAATAAVAYDEVARSFLRRGKFQGRIELLDAIAEQLAVTVRTRLAERPALVVPVPSLPWVRWVRGADPAARFARHLARELRLPFSPRALGRRWSARAELKRLGAAQREEAAARAFYVRSALLGGARTVWLVDDVLTTGATASACARALRDEGAARVHVLVWARTPRPGGRPARRPV